MLDWTDLRFVLAVARARSFTAAGRALGVDQSTVTRRIAALHAALGARLLERRGGAQELTALGERLRPMLDAMEAQAFAVEQAAQGTDARPAGTVRLTTIETLAAHLVAPALGRLRALAPDVDLEIDSTPRTLDLGRRETDIALRVARPRQDSVVARRLGVLGFALYASPAYLARRGTPRPGASFAGHDVLGDDEANYWSVELKWLAAVTPGARVVARLQSWPARLAAVESGAGISVLPCLLGDAAPGAVRLGGGADGVRRELWLMVHRELKNVARIRVVLDFVAGIVTDRAAELAGLAWRPGPRAKVRRT
jgi:DNA-binding transcriptional LysR family regulator